MNKLFGFRLSVLVMLAVTTACGAETPNRLVQNGSELEGEWLKDCHTKNGQSALETLSVVGDRIERTLTLFSGDTCDAGGELMVARVVAKHKIGRASDSEERVKELDIFEKSKFIIVVDDRVASQLNLSQFYGHSDWVAGAEKNLTNRTEDGRTTAENATYTVFSVEGSKLCLGASTDKQMGSTREKRIRSTQDKSDCYLKR